MIRMDGGPRLIEWDTSGNPPEVEKGVAKDFIVAVKRKGRQKIYSFPATYLNAHPLEYDGDCMCKHEDDHDDGCPTTGWFTHESSNQYDGGLYNTLLNEGDELVAYTPVPQYQP